MRDMRRGRWALLGTVALALGVSACGGGSSGSSASSGVTGTGAAQTSSARSATSAPPRKPSRNAHIIDSFQAILVNQHVVELRWSLARPAALNLTVAGLRHGSTHGQSAGDFPIPPSHVDARRPAGKGPGTSKVDFEVGEYNFQAYTQIQFRLRARGRDGGRDVSHPIILSRSNAA